MRLFPFQLPVRQSEKLIGSNPESLTDCFFPMAIAQQAFVTFFFWAHFKTFQISHARFWFVRMNNIN
jgi:hypothetical protein